MTTQLGEGLTLHTDFYELNMMNTFFEQGISERNAVFEVFFRDLPFGSGFAVFAGLEHVMDYLNHLKFSEDDLAYLQSRTDYSDAFIDYLIKNDLDVCGENGEYHTLVIDGPLFSKPVTFKTQGIYESSQAYSLIIEE